MNVLVTGAAGRLGSRAVEQLAIAGHNVIATDMACQRPLGVPLREANLLDEAAVAGLMEGVEAVVHLGNHPDLNAKMRRPARTFAENMAMNMNVLNAASAAGVPKTVFASSIQVIASTPDWPTTPPHATRIAYLPLDSASPPNPTNAYALSKYLTERMLEDYFVPRGMSAIAVRFPGLTNQPRLLSRLDCGGEPSATTIAQGFAYLSYVDAARLIVAILGVDLGGFRVYLPARSGIGGELVRPAIERYYSGIPLRRPIERIESLIDSEIVRQETGWNPLDE